VQCEQAVPAVASLVACESPASKRQEQHVAECLRCQATIARDRRLRRSLADLKDAIATPRPELLPELLLAVHDAAAEEAERSTGHTRRIVYLSGAAAAATAAAAGGIALALASRRRESSRSFPSRLVG
jgi:hypothetical protein